MTRETPRCDACGHTGRELTREVRDGITLTLCRDYKLCCHTWRSARTQL